MVKFPFISLAIFHHHLYLLCVCLCIEVSITSIHKQTVAWRISYKRQELLALRGRLFSLPAFHWVRVADLISFLYGVFCCVCLRPVSCVLGVASFSALSIHDCAVISYDDVSHQNDMTYQNNVSCQNDVPFQIQFS